MDDSAMQLSRREAEEEEEEEEQEVNGSAERIDPLPRNRNGAHKLQAANSRIKHHKALSMSALTSPTPLTALTPSSSASSLIHQLSGQLQQLRTHSQLAIDTLLATDASPALSLHFQNELDAYQAAFLSAASSLAPPVRSLNSHYSDRLEGAADDCRALSYRVSASLAQLSSSVAGTATETIHSVYGAYRSLQLEHDNCQLLAAVAVQLQAALKQLQAAAQAVDGRQWMAALAALHATRQGSQKLLDLDTHTAASTLYRRMQDEHDRLQTEMRTAVMADIHRTIRFVHLTREPLDAATSTLPVELAQLLPAGTAARYRDVTEDSEMQPSTSSVLILLFQHEGTEHASQWLASLQSLCAALSLSSTLEAHVQSVVTRWFSAVVSLVGSTGVAHRCAESETFTERSACAVHGSEAGVGGVGQLSAFALVERMADFVRAVAGVGLVHAEPAMLQLLTVDVVPLLVQQLLPATLPSSVTERLSYDTTSKQVEHLGVRLSAAFELPLASVSPLQRWCAAIDQHFLRNLRLVTLDRCRELLVNNDYQLYHADQPAALSSALASYPPLYFPTSTSPYTTLAASAVNKSSFTPTPEPVPAPAVQLLPLRLQARVLSSYLASHSPISLHACLYSATLFELLGQSLHAHTVSASLCSSLLSTLCDCVLLVLSIPGVYNSDQLQSVGYMSWLYASDCSYLAVCVEQMAAFVVTETRLAAISSASFFPSIQGTAPPAQFASEAAVRLLALVEPLRAVSLHWKRHTLTQLTSSVISSLDALPPFTSLDSPVTLRATLSSLQQTIHTLTRSLRALRDVERAEGRQLIGRRLVARLCDAVVGRVLSVQDVGIEEAKGMEAAVAAVNCGEVRELVGGGWQGREWRRLEAVQLLIGSEQTLVKIEAEWEAGMLSVLEAAEVSGWIRALYQDSANRQRLLQKLSG